MKVMGIDQAITSGWCVAEKEGTRERVLGGGVYRIPELRGDSKGMRFVRFRSWLLARVAEFSPDRICYEQAHHRGGAATEMGVGLTTIIQAVAAEAEIEYAGCQTQQLKLYAAGAGNAEKSAMIAAARERFRIIPEDDNHADALCLTGWGLDECPVRDVKTEKRRAREEKERVAASLIAGQKFRVWKEVDSAPSGITRKALSASVKLKCPAWTAAAIKRTIDLLLSEEKLVANGQIIKTAKQAYDEETA